MRAPSRYRQFLGSRYRAILGYTGLVLVIVGAIITLPTLVLLAYPRESGLIWDFLLPGITLSVAGGLIWRLLTPRGAVDLNFQEGAVIVVLTWFVAVIAGAVPLTTAGGLSFTQAIFESTSGWTTTGLSVVDVTAASHIILLYRSVLQLAGGAGLAIITLAALTGPLGVGLSSAEGRSELLVPHVRRSARLVLDLYLGFAAMGFLALSAAGMEWFDALNHALAALSTGGFSTRVESIGYWDSPIVEAVTAALMLIGGLNFLTGYVLVRGHYRDVAKDGEVRLQAVLLPLGSALIFFGVAVGLYPTFGKAVRVAVFESVTALTTTGFSTVSYTDWPSVGWLVLIAFMIVGAGAGSTGGALKQFRVYVLLRDLLWEVQRMLLPGRVVHELSVWRGGKQQFLSSDQVRRVGALVFLYIATLGIGTTIISAYGYSLAESLFEFASSLGTVGLSVGITRADAPAGVLWTEIAGMFLGRLEFFVIFVGLAKLIRDGRHLLV